MCRNCRQRALDARPLAFGGLIHDASDHHLAAVICHHKFDTCRAVWAVSDLRVWLFVKAAVLC